MLLRLVRDPGKPSPGPAFLASIDRSLLSVGAYGYWVAGLNKGPVSTSTVWAYLFAIGGRLERAHVGLPGLFRRAPDSFYRVQALRLRRRRRSYRKSQRDFRRSDDRALVRRAACDPDQQQVRIGPLSWRPLKGSHRTARQRCLPTGFILRM
jgi:hypothetical protein